MTNPKRACLCKSVTKNERRLIRTGLPCSLLSRINTVRMRLWFKTAFTSNNTKEEENKMVIEFTMAVS